MKNMNPEIYIIIPVFNEDSVIRGVLRDVKKYGYDRIIVIDDGSLDDTYKNASNVKGVTVLRHSLNRGKGAALKTGIEAAKILGADIVVTFDGDGQHDPEDIAHLVTKINKGFDVVLGSRFLSRQKIPIVKRAANFMANCLTYLTYGIWVTDSQSGLRSYTRKAFEVIDTQSNRYEVESEILREIKRHHLKYVEIPMHVRYTKYSQEKINKQNAFSGIITMMKMFLSA